MVKIMSLQCIPRKGIGYGAGISRINASAAYDNVRTVLIKEKIIYTTVDIFTGPIDKPIIKEWNYFMFIKAFEFEMTIEEAVLFKLSHDELYIMTGDEIHPASNLDGAIKSITIPGDENFG